MYAGKQPAEHVVLFNQIETPGRIARSDSRGTFEPLWLDGRFSRKARQPVYSHESTEAIARSRAPALAVPLGGDRSARFGRFPEGEHRRVAVSHQPYRPFSKFPMPESYVDRVTAARSRCCSGSHRLCIHTMLADWRNRGTQSAQPVTRT